MLGHVRKGSMGRRRWSPPSRAWFRVGTREVVAKLRPGRGGPPELGQHRRRASQHAQVGAERPAHGPCRGEPTPGTDTRAHAEW